MSKGKKEIDATKKKGMALNDEVLGNVTGGGITEVEHTGYDKYGDRYDWYTYIATDDSTGKLIGEYDTVHLAVDALLEAQVNDAYKDIVLSDD